MPNKKKQRNGFYFFMVDLQAEWARSGRFVRMENMASLSHHLWQDLPADEKAEYEKKAKEEKRKIVQSEDGKLDAFGNPVQLAVKKKNEALEKRNKMLKDIQKQIRELGSMAAIARKSFYILKFNVMCRTDDKVYIPCEVGIIEYSIQKGIIRQYHKFIDPGPLPQGYKFTCKEQSESTHGIPVENFENASHDYTAIYDDLKDFVKPKLAEKFCSIVYTFEDFIEETELCLAWLHEKSGDRHDMSFGVYDVAALLVELRNAAERELGTKDLAIYQGLAKDLLTKSIYDYHLGVGCKWHDTQDRQLHCALAKVKRYGYFLSENLCDRQVFNVDMIVGAHFPEDDTDVATELDYQENKPEVLKSRFRTTKPEFVMPGYSIGKSLHHADKAEDKIYLSGATAGVYTEVATSKTENSFIDIEFNDQFKNLNVKENRVPTSAKVVRGKDETFTLNQTEFPDLETSASRCNPAETGVWQQSLNHGLGTARQKTNASIADRMKLAGIGRGRSCNQN